MKKLLGFILLLFIFANIIKAQDPCPGTPTVPYLGKTYNTVQIGNQCWLKENLDVGTRIDGSGQQTDNSTIEKYCYNNDPANCDTYGGLYQWWEVMQYSTTPGVKGICPSGWHIPTPAELQALATAVNNDGNALKREDQGSGGSQGTNTSGFSALLSGTRDKGGPFYLLGTTTNFWSSTEYDPGNTYAMALYGSNVGSYSYYKAYGFSVRCVKDETVGSNPVIIVPGIAGSPLYDSPDDILTDGERIWINKSSVWASEDDNFLNVLRLANDGQQPLDQSYHIKVAPTENGNLDFRDELNYEPLIVYRPLIQDLEALDNPYKLDDNDLDHNEGENMFIFTYDWRKSIPDIGAQFAQYIEYIKQWTGASKVDLICHSLGGLIAKQSLQYGSTGSINKLIFVGTPHRGSPKMLYTALSGVFDLPLGLTPNSTTVKRIMKNMPTTYQLLPFASCYKNRDPFLTVVEQNGSSQKKNYDLTNSFLISNNYNSGLIGQIKNIQDGIESSSFGSIQVYNIRGSGIETVSEVYLYPGWKSNPSAVDPIFGDYGDGTNLAPDFRTDRKASILQKRRSPKWNQNKSKEEDLISNSRWKQSA